MDAILIWDAVLNNITYWVTLFLRRHWKWFGFIFIASISLYACWNNDTCHKKTFGIFENLILNFKRKLANSIQHYEPDCYQINLSGPHTMTGGNYNPRRLGNQTRYIGEDAKFSCSEIIIQFNGSKPHKNQVLWFKDDKPVKNDYRHIIKWRYKILNQSVSLPGFEYIQIDSILKILLIEEEDFGNYTCHVSQRTFGTPSPYQEHSKWEHRKRETTENYDKYCERCEKCDSTLSTENRRFTFDEDDIKEMFFTYYDIQWVSEHRLLKETKTVKEIFVPPGHFLTLGTMYRHLGDPEDITIHYTLNGRDPDNTDNRCSIFVSLFFLFKEDDYSFAIAWAILSRVNSIIPFVSKSGVWTGSRAFYAQCISAGSYGRHDMTIIRKTKDAFGQEILREFSNPFTLDIKPKSSTLLNFYTTNEGNETSPEFNPDCFSQTSLSKPIECLNDLKRLNDHAISVFTKDIYYFLILAFVILYPCCKILHWLWHRQKKSIPLETLANIPMYAEQKPRYHLFISVHEEDLIDVKILIDRLEKSECKVFIPCRDILPGSNVIPSVSNAIIQSVAFIIVASERYVTCLELNDLHTRMILDKATPGKLLVLKLRECQVSQAFRDHCTLVDATQLSVQRQTVAINDWLSSTVLRPDLRSYILLRFFCLCLIAYIVCYLIFVCNFYV